MVSATGVVNIIACLIVFEQVLHYIERRELSKMLISKDLKEYTVSQDNTPPHRPLSAHREVLKRWRDGGGDNK